MREKELRLALICYGGISLAVYMHGVTKEIWHAARASRAEFDRAGQGDTAVAGANEGVVAIYRELLRHMAERCDVKLRVMVDIIAGASAGGINGIFLSRAIASGESLDPLTDLWLDRADVTILLDPDARPLSRFSKFWAVPIAWLASRAPKNTIDTTVERSARAEVRGKLSQFVRARWFAPPFGGQVFSGLLLDAFDAMAAGPKGPALVPPTQPIDLVVTVTDFAGYGQTMVLNSPPEVEETEHRLIFSFRSGPNAGDELSDTVGLAFAARATASFPGAFPPVTVREMDATLKVRNQGWPQRNQFLARQLCTDNFCSTEDRILIDGSVLANAPFKPAIAVLKHRPARREIDRRFVYIDPKPGRRSFTLTGKSNAERNALPGFFGTILKSMSDIPREQPIRDNVEALQSLSGRIRRMRKVLDAITPEVNERIEAVLGRSFFLDRPTAARLTGWRAKTQARARDEAGYSFVAYEHLKLSLVVEELAKIAHDVVNLRGGDDRQRWRAAMWDLVRQLGIDRMGSGKSGDNPAAIAFFRSHDIGYRVRRLRQLARQLDSVAGFGSGVDKSAEEAMRTAVFGALSLYLERESRDFYVGLDIGEGDLADATALVARIAAWRGLVEIDKEADAMIADGLAAMPKDARRALVYGYVGFPFFDAATLPLLQGDGDGEFDAIKIDRISPDDATAIRSGGAAATLKGIQFNSFGAFFSRSFRENDYLWGRLHAAERLIAIIASAAPVGRELPADVISDLQHRAFRAILDEEERRLTTIAPLIAQLRGEIG